MRVSLIGMMGTLKSSAGRILSGNTGMAFLDTDELFQRREGMTISRAFEIYGEEYFREKETQALKEALMFDNVIISCGGGIVLRQENRTLLAENTIPVRLTASPACIYARLKRDSTRPLLKNNSIELINEISKNRDGLYNSVARLTVDTTGDGDGIAADAARIIQDYLSGIQAAGKKCQ